MVALWITKTLVQTSLTNSLVFVLFFVFRHQITDLFEFFKLNIQHVRVLYAQTSNVLPIIWGEIAKERKIPYQRIATPWSKNIRNLADQILKISSISSTANDYHIIPILGLTLVEIMHLFYNHLVGTICTELKKSFGNWQNPDTRNLVNGMWHNIVIKNPYRPSYSPTTNMQHTNSKEKVAMKAVNVSASAFEFGLISELAAMSPLYASILRKINQWIGNFMSDTLDEELLKRLMKDMNNIIDQILSDPVLTKAFKKKQTLQCWQNLMYITMYWLPIAWAHSSAKFERGNGTQKALMRQCSACCKENIICKCVYGNRVDKDFTMHVCGQQIPGETPTHRCGSKIREYTASTILHKPNSIKCM